MNDNPLSRLAGAYLAALRTYIERNSQAGLLVAHELGRRAVALGLETLDLSKIHIHALVTLTLQDGSADARDDMTSRATLFFTEAITPIEETHLHAQEASADLDELNATLKQRTLDLADSQRELQQGITERKSAEAALKQSAAHSTQLLDDSRRLEAHLQDITREILTANEVERKKMSHQLQDEIAQALLGIHMQMLALKKDVAASNSDLAKEIAVTQRLVDESVKVITRLAREFGIPHEK